MSDKTEEQHRQEGAEGLANLGPEDIVKITQARDRARAEQLARMFHDAYEALAHKHIKAGETFIIPPGLKLSDLLIEESRHREWEEVPERSRALLIEVAGKVISEGWLAPELFKRIQSEHSELLDLYFDTGKYVGLMPDDDMKAGPERARALAQLKAHFQNLSVDREIENMRLRTELTNATGDKKYLTETPGEPIPEGRNDFVDILDFAAEELYNAAKGYEVAKYPEGAQKANRAGQAMLEIKIFLSNPANMIRQLVADRDKWQRMSEIVKEKLELTEIGLGQSQEAVVDLVRGHDKMLKLLERFVGLTIGTPDPWDEGIRQLDTDVTALLNSGEVKAIDV